MSETLASPRRLPLTDLSEDEGMFRNQVRQFAEEKVRPLVSKMDAEARMPRELIEACFELGIMGIEIPEKHSGAGGTFFMSILAVEELARVDASLAVLVDVQNTLVNNALLRWGSEDQRARYFPKLAGQWVGAYALSEAGSGSDAFALSCRAVDKGDHYELTGRKLWITNAAEAELFVVMATLDPGRGYKGITSFLVERGFPGFAVGKKEDKLGIRASSTCELILEGCRVPRENVLGEAGKGYKIAIETLNEGRIGIGAQMVGLAQGSFEHGVKYAQERQQFGKPIAEFQAVQFQLADLATEIEAARLLTYNAARRREAGAPFVKEAAMAKLFASRAA
ncbi:MAG TPA: acyl-CoA dehydrogenase family protein, partial [Vicinamibacteria bacterium]